MKAPTARDVAQLWRDGFLPDEIASQLRLPGYVIVTCLRNQGFPARMPRGSRMPEMSAAGASMGAWRSPRVE